MTASRRVFVSTAASALSAARVRGANNRWDQRREKALELTGPGVERYAVHTQQGRGPLPGFVAIRDGTARYFSSPPSSRPSFMALRRSSRRLARSAARFTSSEPTSSSMACSAPSPWRKPRRTTRV